MQETAWRDGRGRQVIHRAWCNTEGQPHRTTGPAWEDWTVLPGGAHVLSVEGWYFNGSAHREGRPAFRWWHIAGDCTQDLEIEEWRRHGHWHRVDGPSYCCWTMEPDGTRRLARERWHVNGKLHRVDGPAHTGPDEFWWHDRQVRQEDLPWLRRGWSFLVALAGFTAATPTLCSDGGAGGSIMFPAWRP